MRTRGVTYDAMLHVDVAGQLGESLREEREREGNNAAVSDARQAGREEEQHSEASKPSNAFQSDG